LVRQPYSGNKHGVIKGMSIVSLVQRTGQDADFYLIDYRVYAPDVDGKTKNDPCQEMLVNALDLTQFKARTILCDGSYASAENLTLIHRRQRMSFITLKRNRRVSLRKERGSSHRRELLRTPATLVSGILVTWKEVPCTVRLFKLVAPNGDMDWGSSNERAETVSADVAEPSSDVRWQVEALHRGLRQLTGSE
jgi:hypothetical protein